MTAATMTQEQAASAAKILRCRERIRIAADNVAMEEKKPQPDRGVLNRLRYSLINNRKQLALLAHSMEGAK